MKNLQQQSSQDTLRFSVLNKGGLWVMGQGLLILLFILLPSRPIPVPTQFPFLDLKLHWLVSLLFSLMALVLVGKGMLDLGRNLTPLPYPRDKGNLIQTGVYGIVRHPLYSGLLFFELAWSLYLLSWPHILAALALGLFLDQKANREEQWLLEKYPEYSQYRLKVKKLLPFVY